MLIHSDTCSLQEELTFFYIIAKNFMEPPSFYFSDKGDLVFSYLELQTNYIPVCNAIQGIIETYNQFISGWEGGVQIG